MFRLIRQLARREIAEWRRLANMRAIEKLNDRQLTDIGLRRDQLFALDAELPHDELERPLPEPIYRPEFEPCG